MKLEVGCPTEREAQQYGLQYAETTGIVPWVKTEPNIIGSGLVCLCVEAMFLHTHRYRSTEPKRIFQPRFLYQKSNQNCWFYLNSNTVDIKVLADFYFRFYKL